MAFSDVLSWIGMKRKKYLLHTYRNGIYQKADIFHSASSVMWFLRRNGGSLSQSALTDLEDGILYIEGQKDRCYEVEELVSE